MIRPSTMLLFSILRASAASCPVNLELDKLLKVFPSHLRTFCHGDETKALAAPVIEDDLSVQHSAEPLKELHEVLLPDTQQVTTL